MRKILFRHGEELKNLLPKGEYGMLCSKYSGLSKNGSFFLEREASNDLDYIKDILENGKNNKKKNPEVKESLSRIDCITKNFIAKQAEQEKGCEIPSYMLGFDQEKLKEYASSISTVLEKGNGSNSERKIGMFLNRRTQSIVMTPQAVQEFHEIDNKYSL